MDRHKYRAWLPDEKRMITDSQEFFPLIVTNKGLMKLNPQIEKDNYYFVNVENLILMQFTGFKDKNGKLIYEGDLVIWKYTNHVTGLPYEYVCRVEWDLKKGRWNLIPVNVETKSTFSIWDNYSLEVIGNIYENPELLKEGE